MRTRLAAALLVASAVLPPLAPAAAQCELAAFDTFDFGAGNGLAAQDRFGYAVAIDGEVLAVSAPYNDEAGVPDIGGVYVYRWDGDDFAPEAKLQPAAAGPSEFTGTQLSLDGDVLLASSNLGLTEFRWNGVAWNETTTLALPAVLGSHDMQGGLLVLGSSNAATGSGQVWIYTRGPSEWEVDQVLPNPFPGQTQFFGLSVSVSGDAVVASARGTAPGVDGVAFVYRKGPGGWSLEDSVTASDGLAGDLFGDRVALSGDVLAVSSTHSNEVLPGTRVEFSDNGSVYVFRNNGAGNWVEEAQLVSQGMGTSILFGRSLALDGDVLAAGSGLAAPFAASGDVAVFHRRDGAWHEDVDPVPDDIAAFDSFGIALAVSGEIVVAGSYAHDTGGVNAAGRAYAFDVHPVVDLGSGLAGFGGAAPVLDLADGLCPGGAFDVTLADARPSSPAWLVVGTSVLGAPFKGGTLVPTPDILAGPFVTSAAGALDLAFVWPAGFGGLPTVWQAAVQDVDAPVGFAFSNGLSITAAGL